MSKVADKIFAFLGSEHPTAVGLKCGTGRPPTCTERCRHRNQIGLLQHGWNSLRSTAPSPTTGELIDLSYDLVVAKLPKAKRPPAETVRTSWRSAVDDVILVSRFDRVAEWNLRRPADLVLPRG